MEELRINAALVEMQNTINILIQRNINLAGDLAVANAHIKSLTVNDVVEKCIDL